MKHEKTCGGIVFLDQDCEIKFLLIKNIDWGHWSFPKGRNEDKESEKETVKREILEEVGLKVKMIDGFREENTYNAEQGLTKTGVFFLCSAESSDVKPQEEELTQYLWLKFEDAMKKLTHDANKEILKKANEFIKLKVRKK